MGVCDQCQGYENPSLAVDACVRRGDEVLLIQRKHPPNVGSWGCPGGFMDVGETAEQGALRELEEETGIRGCNPRLLMVMSDPERDERKHVVSIVYEVDMVDESQDPRPGDDAADARFVPISDVLGGAYRLNGDHEDVLRAWLQPS
ncbi:MAG TPA: NUDIX hydrolase [Candidatus Poseidoniales archaeon]|nr:MAG TPA: NUDIX hydrolase [Candidatus Poseidoniales archaeon]